MKIYDLISPERLSEKIEASLLKTMATSYIEAAEKAIEDGHKDNYSRFHARLKKRNLNFGICWFILKKFDIDVTFNPKVQDHVIGKEDYKTHWTRQYWHPSPHEADTKKKLVEMLQARIEILEDWL